MASRTSHGLKGSRKTQPWFLAFHFLDRATSCGVSITGRCVWELESWVRVSAPLCTSCVTLGKSLNLSQLQFSCLLNRGKSAFGPGPFGSCEGAAQCAVWDDEPLRNGISQLCARCCCCLSGAATLGAGPAMPRRSAGLGTGDSPSIRWAG